jgi:hypothetical protein
MDDRFDYESTAKNSETPDFMGKLAASQVDLTFTGPGHQVLNGVACGFSFIQDGMHLLGDRYFHSVSSRKLHGGVGGVNTFGDHAVHASDNLGQFASAPEFDSYGTISRKASGAGEHKIA